MISGLLTSSIRCFRVDTIFFEGGVRKIVKKVVVTSVTLQKLRGRLWFSKKFLSFYDCRLESVPVFSISDLPRSFLVNILSTNFVFLC